MPVKMKSSRIIVGLIFGGRSAEHEVSVRSAAAIFRNLDRRRYTPRCLYVNKNGKIRSVPTPCLSLRELNRGRFHSFLPWSGTKLPFKADIYFPILHGPLGEDGTIQGLLELADVPYVGAGVAASAIAMDKALMKTVFKAAGLPQVPHKILREEEWRRTPRAVQARIRDSLHLPVFVKPANLGSSVGITRVKSWARLNDAIDTAFLFDRKALAEQGISGRELECSVLGNDAPAASLPGEIVPSREFYDYEDKYKLDKAGLIAPAVLPADLVRKVRRLSLEAFKAVDGEGMARIDFFLESNTRRLYVNEINTIPGFTSISMYPRLWECSGLPFPQLLDRLIRLGFERHRARRRRVDRNNP